MSWRVRVIGLMVGLVCGAACATEGNVEAWTNHAGHAIQAVLIGCSAGDVTFQTPAGKLMVMPISALCSNDQQRVRKRCAKRLAPPFARTAYRDAAAMLKRSSRLESHRGDGDAQRAVLRAALALFDSRIAVHDTTAVTPSERAEIARLREALCAAAR